MNPLNVIALLLSHVTVGAVLFGVGWFIRDRSVAAELERARRAVRNRIEAGGGARPRYSVRDGKLEPTPPPNEPLFESEEPPAKPVGPRPIAEIG